MKRPENSFENERRLEKEQRWEELKQEVESITDGLGKGIDEGIKETTTALLANGFSTSQSCEGHIKETAATQPWVEIYMPEPEGWKEDKDKQGQWKKENLEQREKAEEAVKEFYEERQVPFDEELSFEDIGIFGGFRVQSTGSAEMKNLSFEEQKEKLKKYKKEMDAFTEFLKEKFFNK